MSTREVLAELNPGLRRLVESRGWRELRPVQREAFPVLLAGSDAVVEAPTSGGKTEGVLFPALTRIADLKRAESPRREPGVRILYLAPLRALLNDLELRALDYASACGLHAFKWHGDVEASRKAVELRQPPDLLLTTPESTEAILLRRAERGELFARLEVVIVDEAHSFAAGDRGGHLLCLLERLEAYTNRPPQRIALTATVGNIEHLVRWLAGSRTPGKVVQIPPAAPRREVQVRFFAGDDGETRQLETLQGLLPGARSLVFVRSRRKAEQAAQDFAELETDRGRPLRIRTHHGSVSRFYREEAERLIRMSSEDGIDAVLSTSTLELGIDVGALDQVVQLGSLASPSALLQRVGRTGRREGKAQRLFVLLDDEDELPVLAATVALALEGSSEAIHLPSRAFQLLAHQLLCLSLERHGVGPREAWARLRGADCFRGISTEEAGELVHAMVGNEYLRIADGRLLPGERTEREFLRANWRRLFAVFESAPLYDVIHRRQQVGTFDAAFAARLEVPCFFVLAGHLWSADRIDHEARIVEASPAAEGNPPSWSSFGGPSVPFETAQHAGSMLHGPDPPLDYLDDAARSAFRRLRRYARGSPWRRGQLVVEELEGTTVRLLSYGGDRVNRALAALCDLRELGEASSDYREVILVKEGVSAPELGRRVVAALTEVRERYANHPTALEAELSRTLSPYPFSPFARCLPDSLLCAALVEQAFDCGRLLDLLSELRLAAT